MPEEMQILGNLWVNRHMTDWAKIYTGFHNIEIMYLCVLKNKLKLYQDLHMGSWHILGATKPAANGLILQPPQRQTQEPTHSPREAEPQPPVGAEGSQLWVLNLHMKSPSSVWESHNRTRFICCGPRALLLRWLLTCKSHSGKGV